MPGVIPYLSHYHPFWYLEPYVGRWCLSFFFHFSTPFFAWQRTDHKNIPYQSAFEQDGRFLQPESRRHRLRDHQWQLGPSCSSPAALHLSRRKEGIWWNELLPRHLIRKLNRKTASENRNPFYSRDNHTRRAQKEAMMVRRICFGLCFFIVFFSPELTSQLIDRLSRDEETHMRCDIGRRSHVASPFV